MADRPGLPRFRPRGFSPPRRFPGSARACGFVSPRSRPWAHSPFRAFPSRQVAHPSSGSLAPLPFFPVEPRCGARGLVTSGLHRLGRRSGVVPGRILPRLEAPFQRRSSHPLPCGRGHASRRLPVTLDLARRTHLGPAVPSTSELSSLRESVHTTRRSTFRLPWAQRPVLSWASSPLQSLAPAKPGALTSPATAGGVPPPAGTARLSARRATPWIPVRPGTSRGLRPERSAAGNPRRQVESRGDDRIIPLDPSADTESLRPGPCCLSAAASTPMTFDEAMRVRTAARLERSTRVVPATHQE